MNLTERILNIHPSSFDLHVMPLVQIDDHDNCHKFISDAENQICAASLNVKQPAGK